MMKKYKAILGTVMFALGIISLVKGGIDNNIYQVLFGGLMVADGFPPMMEFFI